MKKFNLLFILAIFIGLSVNAQRSTKLQDANFSFLKKEKSLNVIFVYDGMTVGKGMTEEAYVAEKVAEKNEKKAGDGDEWKKAWENGKLSVYEPNFKAIFTKKLAKSGIKVSEGDNAHLTLIVKTTRIEPGFYAGVVKKRAEIDCEFIFVETNNKDNIISQIVLTRATGADTFTVSDRIRFAYHYSANKLAGYISKGLK